jgi:hypothetical protein
MDPGAVAVLQVNKETLKACLLVEGKDLKYHKENMTKIIDELFGEKL